MFLLAADPERAVLRRGFPRADDGTVWQTEVFDLAVDDVGDRLPRLVLAVTLEVHQPPFGRERSVLDRNVVRTGVDGPRDRLAVPLQHDKHVVDVVLTFGPRAKPRAFQRMSFLRRDWWRVGEGG